MRRGSTFLCLLLTHFPAALDGTDLAPGSDVVLSEVCYNPPASLGPDTTYEFVELVNRGAGAVDVSGWKLKDRDDLHGFTIPQGTVIAAGAYLVLARDPAAIRRTYGDQVPCVGSVDFSFGNEGDTVRLLDRDGRLVDQVSFLDVPPWPAGADGLDSTLERISPESDITDFSNFAASTPAAPPGTPGTRNSRAGSIHPRHDVVLNEIMYNPVRRPDTDPLRHCPGEEFLELFNRAAEARDLSGWRLEGGVDFAFPGGTIVAPGGYLVVFHDRAAFEAKYGAVPGAVGPYEKELDDGGEQLFLVDRDGLPADYVEYNDVNPWPVNPDGMRGSLELADPWSDNDRGHAWEESVDYEGTPGTQNSAAAAFAAAAGNAGPQITQVEARPASDPVRVEILSGDDVRVDARVLDRQGISSARLEYQVMAAGDYIRRTDPRFATNWIVAEMSLDADRALFTAVIPRQTHRTLVRYRVRAADGAASPLEAFSPRAADPEPNYAYFVYDGLPDYVANERSGFGPPGHAHSGLDKVPVYHLILNAADLEAAMYPQSPFRQRGYPWSITFVHDGHVHDHCGLNLRSGHAWSWPKRPWKVRFNRGNLFDGRFNDGTPYPRKRRTIHFMSAQHDPGKPRGESGVFESLAWRLYREAGVLGATTTFVHLRFIRAPLESDQFLGDFFGSFLETQHYDTTLLQDMERPTDEDSRLYKFEGGPVKRHPDCDPSMADVQAFTTGYARTATREFFEANLDVQRYLSFRAVTMLIDNQDMDSLKNFFYYYSSETQRWEVAPWDLDNTFGADSSGDEPLAGKVLPLFQIEYRNRFRHLWQVLYGEDRMFGIVDQWSGWIRELADADYDRWNTEPRAACPNWPQLTGGNCRQYQPFTIRMRNLKQWIRLRAKQMESFYRDASIPATPANAFPLDGWPAAVPLTLRTSAFADPDAGDTHAATRWLVIERGGDWAYPLWESESASILVQAAVPPQILRPGREYLYRAAHQDSTGRWSFLSEPTSLFAGPPDGTPPAPPAGLTAEHVGPRAIALRWTPAVDGDSLVFGYRVRRDGSFLHLAPIREARFADFVPVPGARHVYEVTAVNGAGLESSPSAPIQADVPPLESLGGWMLPPGGLDYLYDALPLDDAYDPSRGDSGVACLDGSWARARTDDWDGGRPGDSHGAPGGAGVVSLDSGGDDGGPAAVLSIEDPGDLSGVFPQPNNHRVLLLRGTGGGNLLDEGVTLLVRFRVNSDPADLAAAKGQPPEDEKLRGQIGIAHHGDDGDRAFCLWLDGDRLGMPGGHSIAVAMTEFQSVWITLRTEEGKHRARVYLNGAAAPVVDSLLELPAGGAEATFGGNYFLMGLSNREDSGAVQVDYLGFKAGVHDPAPAGPGATFRRGDPLPNGQIDVADALAILRHLFTGEERFPCPDAADADDSGRLNITDPLYLLRYVFLQGVQPAPPFPVCGTDDTPDALVQCVGETGC